MRVQYVHTLLFDCPNCNHPVSVSLVTERVFEFTDAKKYRIECGHCWRATELSGVMAKRHWVEEWPEVFDKISSGIATCFANVCQFCASVLRQVQGSYEMLYHAGTGIWR
jgi:transcription elongation factor Elf1